MFHISTSFENCAVDVAIFSICLLTLLTSRHHLVANEFLFLSLEGILHADFRYPSLSSFINKSQIRPRLQLDLCRQILLWTYLQNLNTIQTYK